jgi:hypothetical protein
MQKGPPERALGVGRVAVRDYQLLVFLFVVS